MSRQLEEQSLIRKYLLGDLEEGQRERVELRLLSDADFAESVSGARQDLFEEYAAGALDAPEREGFERHCLKTHGALEKLRFARALNRSVDSRLKELDAAAGSAGGDRPRGLRRLLTRNWLRVAVPVAAALLLAVGYATWQLSQRRAPGNDLRAALARNVISLNTPGGGDNAAPGGPRGRDSVHGVTLRQGIVREAQGLPRVAAPAGAEVLELRLVLEGEPYPSYRVALLTDEEAEVAAVGGLKAEGAGGERALVFRLPARGLPRGDYQLKVEGVLADGRTEAAGRYPFRVQAP